MHKYRIARAEKKLSLKVNNTEAPIFLFRTKEGVTLSDYSLRALGIPPKAFTQSISNPEERILESGEYLDIQESYAYLRNPEKTFIIIDL